MRASGSRRPSSRAQPASSSTALSSDRAPSRSPRTGPTRYGGLSPRSAARSTLSDLLRRPQLHLTSGGDDEPRARLPSYESTSPGPAPATSPSSAGVGLGEGASGFRPPVAQARRAPPGGRSAVQPRGPPAPAG